MRRLLIASAALILLPSAVPAQERVGDPEIYETGHFRRQCQSAEFEPGFLKRFDINNDGLIDAVSDHGKLSCDGKRGPGCDTDGCTHNFYVQVKEGGYLMVATAKLYGYDFVKYFGNMVFMLKAHPRLCERSDRAPCEMRVRVRGLRFVTLSMK